MMNRCLSIAVLFGGLLLAEPAAEARPRPMRVSLVKGQAKYLRSAAKYTKAGGPREDAPWKRLVKGTKLRSGDAVRTQKRSRIEIVLADGSRIRLGSESMVTLDEGRFRKKGGREVGVTTWVGRIWAKAAKALGGDSKFEVRTANAVAGVRGTSFTVVANQDLSAVVRVYSGTVGVRKNTSTAPGFRNRPRVQVEGPERIDKEQWEEIVATQMQEVTVTSLGKIMPADDFVDQGEELEWAMWNQKRDAAVQ